MNKIFSKAKLSSAFLLLTLTWGIDILFEKLTPQKKGVEFEKHLLHTMSMGLGILLMTCSLIS